MTSSTSMSGFPVPLTSKAWVIAQQFVQPQFDAEHNQRQFRQGLALFAVDFYLKCMALETEPCDRTAPILSQFLDGAALMVKGVGRLECCLLEPGETAVNVPVDAWCDRIAYVIVHIEERLQQAQILGFNPQPVPADGHVALDQLQPLDALPQYLYDSQTTALAKVWTWANAQGNALSEAVIGAVHGWQLPAVLEPTLADWAYRGSQAQAAPSDHVLVSKAIDLDGLDLNLVMDLAPIPDGGFRIELMVESGQPLPSTLQLRIVDATGQTFEQSSPDRDGLLILSPFRAAAKEQFAIELMADEATYVENIAI